MLFPSAMLIVCVLVGGCAALEGTGLTTPRRATLDVTGFGAQPDDDGDDTVAFRHALEAVRQIGGGTVVVPRGTYRVGPLDLPSGLTLRLDAQATLVFHDRADLYRLVDTRWEGVMQPARRPLLWVDNGNDVAIVGGGVIDGSGARWWEVLRQRREGTRAESPATRPGDEPEDRDASVSDRASDAADRRPPLLQVRNSRGVRVEGVTIQNPPKYAVHVLFSAGVTLRNVRLTAPAEAIGADGVVVDSSREVLIERCYADVGESEAFAVRSGRDEDGRRMNRPSGPVTVRGCTIGAALAGLAIGPDVSAGVSGVRMIDCTINGADTGVLIAARRGGGGSVLNVALANLTMTDVAVPFFAGMLPGGGEGPAPRIGTIGVAGLRARGASRAGIIDGIEQSPVAGLEFRNLDIAARYGITCNHATGVRFRDCVISTDFGPAMIRTNTSDLRLDRWQETTPEPGTRPAGTGPSLGAEIDR